MSGESAYRCPAREDEGALSIGGGREEAYCNCSDEFISVEVDFLFCPAGLLHRREDFECGFAYICLDSCSVDVRILEVFIEVPDTSLLHRMDGFILNLEPCEEERLRSAEEVTPFDIFRNDSLLGGKSRERLEYLYIYPG